MNRKKTDNEKNNLWAAISLALLIFTLVQFFLAIRISGGSLSGILLYSLSVILYILLPGLFLYRFLCPDEGFGRFSVPAGTLLGIALLFVLYLLSSLFPSGDLILKVIPLILSMAFIANCLKEILKTRSAHDAHDAHNSHALSEIEKIDSSMEKADSSPLPDLIWSRFRSMAPEIIAFSILLAAFTWGGILANPKASIIGETTYYQDFLWHIGNVNSFKMQGLPPMDIHASGLVFRYHYFNDLLAACLSIITAIPAFDIILYYSQPFLILLLLYALSGLGAFIFDSKKKAGFFIYINLFMGCAGSLLLPIAKKNITEVFMNRTLYHIITNVNSLAIAISSCIIFTLLLLIELRNNKIKPKSMLFFSILFALVAGFKGPVAMLIFATLLVILIIQLLRKKRIDGFVPFVSLISLIFILFYFYLFSAGTESTVSFNPAATVKNSVIGMLLRKVMGERSISNILYLILIPLHFIAYIPFQSLLYLNGLRSDIRRFFSLSASDYLINGMALGGITATYLFGHPGNSQVAFLHTALPFITLLAIRAFDGIRAKRRGFVYLAAAIGIFSTIIGFAYLGSSGYGKYQQIAGEGQRASSKYSISEYDQEAMEWLRENTPEDSIFATNRLYQAARDDGRFFYYTAISERQAFLEGYAYTKNSGASDEFINEKLRTNNLIFSNKVGNEAELLNLLKENNIDYIVWSKRMMEYEGSYRSSSFKKVFKNRDILIFEVSEE